MALQEENEDQLRALEEAGIVENNDAKAEDDGKKAKATVTKTTETVPSSKTTTTPLPPESLRQQQRDTSTPGAFRINGSMYDEERMSGDGDDIDEENQLPTDNTVEIFAAQTICSSVQSAVAISDESLAQQQQENKKQPGKTPPSRNNKRRRFIALAILAAGILLLLGLAIALTGGGKNNEASGGNNQTISMTGPQTLVSTSLPPSASPSLLVTEVDEPIVRANMSIYEYATVAKQLWHLKYIIDEINVREPLTDEKFTVFSPYSVDFTAVDTLIISRYSYPEWNAHLLANIERHFIPGEFLERDLIDNGNHDYLTTRNVSIRLREKAAEDDDQQHQADGNNRPRARFTVDGVDLVEPDAFICTNGVIHRVANLMFPPYFRLTLEEYLKQHNSKFHDLLDRYNLLGFIQSEGPMTMFAPTNDAIDRMMLLASSRDDDRSWNLIENTLLYHLIPGLDFGVSFAREIYIPPGTISNETILEQDDQTNYVRWSISLNSALDGKSIPLELETDASLGNKGRIIGGAAIREFDVAVSNAMIHVVDAALTIPSDTGI